MNSRTKPTHRLILAAAGTLLLPRIARAQLMTRRRIAFLVSGSRSSGAPFLGAFRHGLRALGYADEDIAIEERYADGYAERHADLAAELARLAPEVIVAGSTVAVAAVKRATMTIPIVMVAPADPVGAGFVASLAHPGGNVTGLSVSVSFEIAGKSLQLLTDAAPDAKRIAILVNPGYPGLTALLQATQQAAGTLGIDLVVVDARTPDDIDGAFTVMMREHADALIIPGDALFLSEMSRIVALVASHKLPSMCDLREFAPTGGLMSYGIDLKDNFRRAASYVDKILKGARPADLPVEQPTKFQLIVNLKTAHALGLTIPPAILAGADEVIE